jgi:adenylate cyclase
MESGQDPAFSPTMGRVRKLAAILSADVEGYSRLMGEDEEATIRTVTVYRDVIAALVQQHRGRVVDAPGDNLLAEFASVLDAVQCAVAIQRELNARNTALPLPRRMQFRLGLNLGDVIPDGERIYGDGVNVAARLEGLAEAGGICISGTVYDQVATKLPLTYKFLGQQTVKNIARPVRAYRVQATSEPADLKGRLRHWRGAGPRPRMALVVMGLLLLLGGGVVGWRLFLPPSGSTAGAPAQQAAGLALPNKPSIAVLPFVNMSDDPGQEYFSDGMTEDLITELSALSGLFVIARNSVFTYKGKAVKPEQVRQELGVRYLIEGSVRKANNRIRITAQLVDATTGYHMWAQYYDRDLHDIFAVQEEIARRITRALAVRLTPEEEEHMGRPYTDSVEAWENFMRGLALYRLYKKAANAQARVLFEKAISLDSEFAKAYAMLAATHRQDGNMEWTQDREISEALAYHLAHYAVDLASKELKPQPSLPYALEQLGWVLLYRGDHQGAKEAAQKAVLLNPNFAEGYALEAHVLTYLGEPEESLDKTDEAIRHNPKYSFLYDYHRGHAYYVWGYLTSSEYSNTRKERFEDAVKHLREALRRNNNHRPARAYLVAALMELAALDDPGKRDKAKEEMKTLLDQGRLPASQDVERFKDYIKRSIPYKVPGSLDYILDHLTELWQLAEQP